MGNDNAGSCPGGMDSECTDIPPSHNPDCVDGVCGYSFCAVQCDDQGNCEVGYEPMEEDNTCYCVPID